MPGSSAISVFTTGGTIDKDYPRAQGGYAFEFGDTSAAACIFALLPPMTAGIFAVCQKDSTEVTEADREALCNAIKASSSKRVVVTHGTDTLIETARLVVQRGAAEGKAVVFTGATRPQRFQDSDASFNLGGAVAATDVLSEGSVSICMGGRVIPAARCVRDPKSGRFCDEREDVSIAAAPVSKARQRELPAAGHRGLNEQRQQLAQVSAAESAGVAPRSSNQPGSQPARSATGHMHDWKDPPAACGRSEGTFKPWELAAVNAAGVSTQSAEYARMVWCAPTTEGEPGPQASQAAVVATAPVPSIPAARERQRWVRPASARLVDGAAGCPTTFGSRVLSTAHRSMPDVGYAQCSMTR